MNILILTGRYGLGHVKAAEAIYSSFTFLTARCSRVYNCLNHVADRYGRAPFQHALLRKISCLLDFFQPDLVIATLPFCGQYISAYKEHSGCRIPLYTYITDVTLHEEWIAPQTDLYFVACEIRGQYPRLCVIGFTDEVHRYMKEADMLITKPGGMTTFEAIVTRTPLFILPPALAQEKGNAAFIEEAGIGRVLQNEQMPAAGILRDILKAPVLLESMAQNMDQLEESFANACPLSWYRETFLFR